VSWARPPVFRAGAPSAARAEIGSKAWIWLISSTQNTAACSAGCDTARPHRQPSPRTTDPSTA
jgi:hypothetical protein